MVLHPRLYRIIFLYKAHSALAIARLLLGARDCNRACANRCFFFDELRVPGPGNYIVQMSGLAPFTFYYVRATLNATYSTGYSTFTTSGTVIVHCAQCAKRTYLAPLSYKNWSLKWFVMLTVNSNVSYSLRETHLCAH